MHVISSRFLPSIVFSSIFWLPNYLFAQSGNEPVTDDSTVTYPSSYFSQFAPVSVRDMLDRIPGIDLALGNGNDVRAERFLGGTRGLGGSSQILIDGKRLAGKESEGRTQLSGFAAAAGP